MTRILMGLAGIALILAIAFLLSTNRRAIRLRVVAAAFALQAGIAVLVLYTSWGRAGSSAACWDSLAPSFGPCLRATPSIASSTFPRSLGAHVT